jgi:hypothetical protein
MDHSYVIAALPFASAPGRKTCARAVLASSDAAPVLRSACSRS